MGLHLDYFYGDEAADFRFYRVPKALLDGELSLEAATLYGLMLDRVGLSARNGWVDGQGRVFIHFVQTDVQKRLRCGHNRATAFMRELERAGLIERKRQGLGRPARIYVKNLSGPVEALFPASGEAVSTAPKGRSGLPGEGGPDRPERAAKETEKKETDLNKTHLTSSARRDRDRMDEMGWVREEIRENIDYEGLVRDHPGDGELFDGYVELMVEAACSTRETVRVCGQDIPRAAVRSRLLKLGREHVLYVRDCLCHATAAIGNIKAYTLAALYNAPATMGQYYAALVSRDLAAPEHIPRESGHPVP